MKIHSVKQTYYTGNIKTHFKTKCGLIRHVANDLKTTIVFDKLTCKSCIRAYKHTKP